MKNHAIEEKLRKVISVLMFCSITKSHCSSNYSSSTQETREELHSIDSYRKRLLDKSVSSSEHLSDDISNGLVSSQDTGSFDRTNVPQLKKSKTNTSKK